MPVAAYAPTRNRVVAENDEDFGESIRFEPMVSSQYGGAAADPGRAAFTIIAVLRMGGDEADLGGDRSGNWNAKVPTMPGALHVDRVKLAGRVLKKGDQVVALDRPGQPRFEIARVDPMHVARLVLPLTAL